MQKSQRYTCSQCQEFFYLIVSCFFLFGNSLLEACSFLKSKQQISWIRKWSEIWEKWREVELVVGFYCMKEDSIFNTKRKSEEMFLLLKQEIIGTFTGLRFCISAFLLCGKILISLKHSFLLIFPSAEFLELLIPFPKSMASKATSFLPFHLPSLFSSILPFSLFFLTFSSFAHFFFPYSFNKNTIINKSVEMKSYLKIICYSRFNKTNQV